jgi:hypothetical protein
MFSQRTLTAALSIAIASTTAYAGYESSSAFSGSRSFNPDRSFLAPAKVSSAPMPVNAQAMALDDRDNRIDEAFGVPGPLRNTVSLWLRVYTEFSSEQTVFFDKKHPEVIYEVMDFRDLKRTARNPVAYAIMRERRL